MPGTLLAPCWHPAGTLPAPCRHPAGTLQVGEGSPISMTAPTFA